METWTFDSRGPDETLEIGRELGRSIGVDGLVIALLGPLGAGKTVFVKGLAEGLGVDPRAVSSPTFVIAQQYGVREGPEILHHVDLYRLESEDELEAVGFYDMFAPGAVLAVEWADRFPGALGRELLSIEFEGPSAEEGPDSFESGLGVARAGPLRRARVTAGGEAARRVLSDWADRFEASTPAPDSRPGMGSFIEMRLGLTFVLALALWIPAGVDLSKDPLPICPSLLASGSDELGTSRAMCLSGAASAGVAVAEIETGFEGVGRLLVGDRIDLNRAGARLLETLPGIGAKRAAAIVAARRERAFISVAELERVSGIGPKTRARLERWLRVEAARGAGVTRDG
ncbi:MAG: tRNA (adenosine(37)-N6)-threonylcarbamoyltransferase complex ATPase subunit type 1 TsaE [bacterium]|nr:tRNA (adenosine(37)-N6)-threonylcarbamoyltransferase complex ATPase subunit type 1 TsaE [bacterium]